MLGAENSFRWDHAFPRTGYNLNYAFHYTKMYSESPVMRGLAGVKTRTNFNLGPSESALGVGS